MGICISFNGVVTPYCIVSVHVLFFPAYLVYYSTARVKVPTQMRWKTRLIEKKRSIEKTWWGGYFNRSFTNEEFLRSNMMRWEKMHLGYVYELHNMTNRSARALQYSRWRVHCLTVVSHVSWLHNHAENPPFIGILMTESPNQHCTNVLPTNVTREKTGLGYM